jgi:pyruvate-ferredoxin/flavodoxin oxidoreductase
VLRNKNHGLDEELLKELRDAKQTSSEVIEAQRKRVEKLKEALRGPLQSKNGEHMRMLLGVADHLIKRSIWAFGGDGWAYDIGYGGLDHVIASGKDVNILVLDTEVYSNTGGQMSKSTPIGAIARFAEAGKPIGKKDLGMMAITYGNVYVAKIAMGYNMTQTVRAFNEADAYPGPSIIIAYSHCINQGIDMSKGMEQQKRAVESGAWVLCRYNPLALAEGKNPLTLDSKEPSMDIEDYMYRELRFRALKYSNPEGALKYLEQAREDAKRRYRLYSHLADAALYAPSAGS